VPTAADASLLTGLLRDTWGFKGTVVADYFGVAFLKNLHGVAGTFGEAAGAALAAGVDVELPTVHAFGEHLITEVEAGRVPVSLIDRALRRVLVQKIELGLLDEGWSPVPSALQDADTQDSAGLEGSITLDTRANRELAARIAEESIILASNNGILPLRTPGRIAVVGPNADNTQAFLGCYSFPAHVGGQHPEVPVGIELPTVAEALRAEFPDSAVTVTAGCTIDGASIEGFDDAVAAAAAADVVIAVMGDRAGLFGRGTSGEGCDVESLVLPGVQQQLLDRLVETGVPVVLVLLTGRPYAVGSAVQNAAAIVQAFFPGEEGGPAVARVLSGAVNPSGRLPVSIPARPGAQPSTYLASPLARASSVSNIDPAAAFPFGHGLSYTTFEWDGLTVDGPATLAVDGAAKASLTVTNTGDRAGVELVQLYLHDPVASVVRPVQKLVGYARVPLEAKASARVTFTVPADVTSFTGRDGRRIVEAGDLELRFGASSGDIRLSAGITLTGETRTVDHTRSLHCGVTVTPGT
jgi:beta-xylosidase